MNFGRVAAVALLLVAGGISGKAEDTGLAETNLIPENVSLWTESMLWDKQVTVSTGLGYNENVLLSTFAPQGSAFFDNGIDLMVLRVPLDGWKVVGSLTGDDRRYWRDVGTDREDSFAGSVRVEREFDGGWQVGWENRDLYEHEVLDITTLAASPATALVDGFGVTVAPSVRKNLLAGWWLKLEMPVTRWLLESPLDNYWQFGPVVTMGYDFGERADVTASYHAWYERHDNWRTDSDFGQVPSQLLEIFDQEMELAWHQYWDADRRLRSTTRLALTWREDNGDGFFNFFQYELSESLRWQSTNWMAEVSADFSREDYPVQTVGFATHDPDLLHREFWQVSTEVERRIYKGLKTFAKWDYEECISNEESGSDNYHANVVLGGLRYEF